MISNVTDKSGTHLLPFVSGHKTSSASVTVAMLPVSDKVISLLTTGYMAYKSQHTVVTDFMALLSLLKHYRNTRSIDSVEIVCIGP